MDNNSTINSTFDINDCSKQTHVGMVVSYVVMLLCSFLGTPAQSWLLWLLLHDGWKIKPTQVFHLNHVVLELIYCIKCVVEMLNVLIFKCGKLWKVTFIFFGLSSIGRSLIQVCICVEQYVAVLHPIIFLKYKGIQYRIAPAAAVWLILVAHALYEDVSNNFPDPVFDIVFFTAVTVISFCCVSVLRALKHPGPGDTQITTQRGRDVGNQQKRDAFKTILSELLIILITYLPEVSLTVFTVIKIDIDLLVCDIIPFMSSFNILSVMITPLLKIYKRCHLKC